MRGTLALVSVGVVMRGHFARRQRVKARENRPLQTVVRGRALVLSPTRGLHRPGALDLGQAERRIWGGDARPPPCRPSRAP